MTSALYFKGTWLNEFDRKQTHGECFYRNGVCKTVAMMNLEAELNYAHVDDLRAHALELPYQVSWQKFLRHLTYQRVIKNKSWCYDIVIYVYVSPPPTSVVSYITRPWASSWTYILYLLQVSSHSRLVSCNLGLFTTLSFLILFNVCILIAVLFIFLISVIIIIIVFNKYFFSLSEQALLNDDPHAPRP